MKVNRSNYWWYSFKMRYLVPNYERSVGPAWWIWNAKDWLHYNLDTDNYCSLISHFIRWKNEKLVKWLSPWLFNARKFLFFCIEQNGTKLLDCDANYFYVRTRDENQFYFIGRVNLFGKVNIVRKQWVDSNGRPKNLFLYGIVNGLCNGHEEVPMEQAKLLFSGFVLTSKQLKHAEDMITQNLEFGWDWLSISTDKFIDELKPDDRVDFEKKLYRSVLDEYFPGTDKIYNLEENDYRKFEAIVCNMSVDEARKRTM